MTWPYDSDRRQLIVDVSRSVSVFLVWTTVQPRRQFAAAALLLFCLMSSRLQSFIHFWHAPLVVCSAKRRRQSPEWTILTHVNCYIQGEVIGFQVLLESLFAQYEDVKVVSSSSPKGEAVKIFLASVL